MQTDANFNLPLNHVLPALGAALTAVVVSLAAGPRCIGWLGARFVDPGKPRADVLATASAGKQPTPTMGGILLLIAFAGSACLWCRWDLTLAVALTIALGLAAIGACDDLSKLRRGRGMTARSKLAAQLCLLLPIVCAWNWIDPSSQLFHWQSASALASLLLATTIAAVWIALMANAVNLTDGLDGLAAGCALPACLATIAACIFERSLGHAESTVPMIANATLLAAALAGALLGFLAFNRRPARVYLGDTGSLALGGVVGFLALNSKLGVWPWVWSLVFLVEAASVVVQVAGWRLTRKRVLLCAPLHHHFQLRQWSEAQVVRRFWLAASVAAATGFAGFVFSRMPSELPQSPALAQSQNPLQR